MQTIFEIPKTNTQINNELVLILKHIKFMYDLNEDDKYKEVPNWQFATPRFKTVSFPVSHVGDTSHWPVISENVNGFNFTLDPETSMFLITDKTGKREYHIHVSMILRVLKHLKTFPLCRKLKK